jgi:hypothetical protein
MSKRKRQGNTFSFIGRDERHAELSQLDGTLNLTYEEKFALICELTLFHYQLTNKTNDIPRLLRTTACIRKA